MLRRLCLFMFALISLGSASAAMAATAWQADIKGPIGPGVALYVQDTLEAAAENGAGLVILRLDTPGGLDLSMRDIIHAILASPVPVATYVGPSGARAASAGTYILYASHIAAMAPAINLGAATPVQLGGAGKLPEVPRQPAQGGTDDAPQQPDSGDAMSHKMINDASAYIRSLASLRGRNAEWAEKAVREAASLSAEQALQQHVIDLIATDEADLLRQIDGRQIELPRGSVTLNTDGMRIEHREQGWRSEFLAIITDPNIAYILMLLAMYGLFFELANPGFVLPGVIGGICLLLALFAMQVLPISFAGLALIGLGVSFMVAEAFVPSFGALGLGGVIAFVIGSLMLMDTRAPGYDLSIALVIGFALSSALFFFAVAAMALKARKQPKLGGNDEMVGATATVRTAFDGLGEVVVHGEVWQAESSTPLRAGQQVRVCDVRDLVLLVEPPDSC